MQKEEKSSRQMVVCHLRVIMGIDIGSNSASC